MREDINKKGAAALLPQEVETELTVKKARTQNTMAIMGMGSVVFLLMGLTIIGVFGPGDNKEILQIAFTILATYTGSIVKDITQAFFSSEEEVV